MTTPHPATNEQKHGPARVAYDLRYTGFSPSGFAAYEKGFDDAHASSLAKIEALERALEMLLVAVKETGEQYPSLETETWNAVLVARP